MLSRVRKTRGRKFCSHLATSELRSVWTRSREPARQHTPSLQQFSTTAKKSNSTTTTTTTIENIYGTKNNTSSTSPLQLNQQNPLKPTTIPKLNQMHRKNKPITMITAYDYTSGLLCDKAGADILLVGDSVGMVVLGHDTTVPVTMDDMVHHIKAVRRATERPLIVGDMPFGSYLDPSSAAINACRLVKEGGCDAVKLEGGKNMVSRIRAITENGMAVQGHIGLLPQHVSSIGGYRVQGKTSIDAVKLLEDALALQEAGCFSIVLEMVPDEVAHAITLALEIPTIGIGAGPRTSGQVQVFHDVVGLYDKLSPKFSKKYVNLGEQVEKAVGSYCEEVRNREFPTMEEHTFLMPSKQSVLFQGRLMEDYPDVSSKIILKEKESKEANENEESKESIATSQKSKSKAGPSTNAFLSFEEMDEEQKRARLASSLIAEQWRTKMIQAYHQEALLGNQRATMRHYSSLATVEKHLDDDEYASYRNTQEKKESTELSQKKEVSELSSSPQQASRLVEVTATSPLIVNDVHALRQARLNWMNNHNQKSSLAPSPPTVGFVPTMGALHAGHLNLVQKAKEENDIVVVSIYINPTQFAEHEDLDVYPRDLQSDVKLLEALGVDVVYAPTESLYSSQHQTWVVPDIDGKYDEGASRPGFFRGVATVVTKLLNHVQPNVAYFGQKDAQQCAVIQDLVRDLDIGASVGEKGMRIDIVPTVRESDGLAMSSRNAYLSQEDRAIAPALYEALVAGRTQILGNETDDNTASTVGAVRENVFDILKKRGVEQIEYVTVANVRTTKPMLDHEQLYHKEMEKEDNREDGHQYMIATAVKIGNTRLIDNIVC